MLGDQDAGPLGQFVRFFGRPASVYRGPAVYAQRFGYPLVTGFIERQSDGKHRIWINPPYLCAPGEDAEAAIERLTRAHTRDLEQAIRSAPEQYFWVHRRWKTQPRPSDTAAV
jgi:KDO2-lipid IV(A) lauroyltransferase